MYLTGIRPCDDEKISGPAGIHRGLDLLDLFFDRDHPLAFHMPATFGPDLIFQKHARGSRLD